MGRVVADGHHNRIFERGRRLFDASPSSTKIRRQARNRGSASRRNTLNLIAGGAEEFQANCFHRHHFQEENPLLLSASLLDLCAGDIRSCLRGVTPARHRQRRAADANEGWRFRRRAEDSATVLPHGGRVVAPLENFDGLILVEVIG